MKKVIALLVFSFISSVVCLLAQEATIIEEETYEYSEYVTRKTGYSHWSVMGKVGLSIFDGDVPQGKSVFPESRDKLALGLEVERSFNPRWGLILEYMYLPIGAKTDNIEFKGKVHTTSLLLSANLTNLFYSKRRKEFPRWNVYFDVGPALSFYRADATVGGVDQEEMKGQRAGSFIFGLKGEYNISRSWAVGLSGQYRMQSKDNFEGIRAFQGNSNDNIFNVALGVRFKFNCKKRIDHIRNIDYGTFIGGINSVSSLQEQLNSLESRLNYVETNMPDRAKTDALDKRVTEIEKFIDSEFRGPDSDGDGVPDGRDKEPNTPRGSYVNYWGVSLPLSAIDETPATYFAFDSYVLSGDAKTTIRDIALKMTKDQNVKLEIRGYADNTGTATYNKALSQRRAEAVKKELVQVYKIDESRITANGLGELTDSRLSRRCDFFFDK